PAVIPDHWAGSHALLTRPPLSPEQAPDHVRLACVRHAASVRSEPGSNSQVNQDNQPARLTPGQQTIQANEDPHQTRFRQAADNLGRTPQASTQNAAPETIESPTKNT